MLSKEISRLRDKDIRQRRKAVRRLFEDGDPSALPHFIPFLNDPDEWFVERAMIAIERWYDGMDIGICLLYTSPSPRDTILSRMPSSA